METARWDKIETLFEEACEVPPERRARFLQERCEAGAVREEVASLLEAYEEAPGFFEDLTDAVVAPALSELEAAGASGGPQGLRVNDPLDLEGSRVGRYAVEEHLGGGGMGVVYRAEDPELSRPVALKFLPRHLSVHREAEERFVREARSAAALDHSNIATIHEIGTTAEGRRFQQLVHEYGVGWVSGNGEAGFLSAGFGLAWTLRRLGREDEARSVARRSLEAIDRSSDIGGPPMTARATAHLVLGDTTAALEEIERAVEDGFRGASVLETSPVLDPLRGHVRFEAIRTRVERLLAEERRRVEAEGWGEPN